MWAILHVPSNTWDHGHSNETLYWVEYEAQRAIHQFGGDPANWRPIEVDVTVRGAK